MIVFVGAVFDCGGVANGGGEVVVVVVVVSSQDGWYGSHDAVGLLKLDKGSVGAAVFAFLFGTE